MSKTQYMTTIENELAGFQPEEREQLSRQIADYLHRVRTLRQALASGEADIAQGRTGTLADLDQVITALRRQYAG